ncbi:fructosamine-3-kinase [Planomicrobium stackebrandtii]|uniref:Fructosamine-3-kinase n=1 Tax=Planomicrobium stackebrandtii TaxID=253160 RepID=A0ABU0GXT4_9BACL|nr:phosphotransferase [Planomicrobium stackebrandtii]MDQ0430152.1 fructosamine-3-kinase [Planomicrobium stackebrandtii]
MDISTIITQLTKEKLLPPANWKYKALTGGTMSQVFLLHHGKDAAYVLKFNKAHVTRPEAEFLIAYQKASLLPELVAVDVSHRYIVYTYIPGSTATSLIGGKGELLQTLVERLINHYQPVSVNESWGWQDAPASSWKQFLTEEVQAAQQILVPFLKKKKLHITAPFPVEQHWNREPFLIHGDCGFHNFIMREKQLAGVIDPTPILGLPHYDLIYAFFSSPASLTKETLDFAFSGMSADLPEKKQLYEEVLIGLYVRLAICVKHHPVDFPAYVKAWDYWSRLAQGRNC